MKTVIKSADSRSVGHVTCHPLMIIETNVPHSRSGERWSALTWRSPHGSADVSAGVQRSTSAGFPPFLPVLVDGLIRLHGGSTAVVWVHHHLPIHGVTLHPRAARWRTASSPVMWLAFFELSRFTPLLVINSLLNSSRARRGSGWRRGPGVNLRSQALKNPTLCEVNQKSSFPSLQAHPSRGPDRPWDVRASSTDGAGNRWGAAAPPNDRHYSPLSEAGARSMKLRHFSPERGGGFKKVRGRRRERGKRKNKWKWRKKRIKGHILMEDKQSSLWFWAETIVRMLISKHGGGTIMVWCFWWRE